MTPPADGQPARRRGAGELEGEVLAVLWSSPAPLTPAQTQATLDGGLAYNTVHTILTRLCDKGLARRTVLDGRPAYMPVLGAAEWAAGQMRAVLDRGVDRTAILHRFVSTLDPASEEILRDALREPRPDSPAAAPRVAGDPQAP
ncbi:MAG TPA: BlaI/MecI/CopY family transcriptional regulator [Rugosimonospora sp.]|nr:BlaI/MecI/CopY family transcriptional regulator [Rugosimonospora sp.]